MLKTFKIKNIKDSNDINVEGKIQENFSISNGKTFIVMEEKDNLKVLEMIETSTGDSQELDPRCFWVYDENKEQNILIKCNKIYELEYSQVINNFKNIEQQNIEFTPSTEKAIIDMYNNVKKYDIYEKVIFSEDVKTQDADKSIYNIFKANNQLKLDDVYKKCSKFALKLNEGGTKKILHCIHELQDGFSYLKFNENGDLIGREFISQGEKASDFINEKLLEGTVILSGSNLHQKYSQVKEEMKNTMFSPFERIYNQTDLKNNLYFTCDKKTIGKMGIDAERFFRTSCFNGNADAKTDNQYGQAFFKKNIKDDDICVNLYWDNLNDYEVTLYNLDKMKEYSNNLSINELEGSDIKIINNGDRDVNQVAKYCLLDNTKKKVLNLGDAIPLISDNNNVTSLSLNYEVGIDLSKGTDYITRNINGFDMVVIDVNENIINDENINDCLNKLDRLSIPVVLVNNTNKDLVKETKLIDHPYSDISNKIIDVYKLKNIDKKNCFTVQDLETGSNKIKKLSELDNYQIYAEDNVEIDVYIDDVKKFHYKYENERDVIHFNQETKQISTDKGIKPLKGPDKDPDKTL